MAFTFDARLPITTSFKSLKALFLTLKWPRLAKEMCLPLYVWPTCFSLYLIRDVFQFFQGFSLEVIFYALFLARCSTPWNDTHSYRGVLLSVCLCWMKFPFFGRRCDPYRSRPLNFLLFVDGLLSPGYNSITWAFRFLPFCGNFARIEYCSLQVPYLIRSSLSVYSRMS